MYMTASHFHTTTAILILYYNLTITLLYYKENKEVGTFHKKKLHAKASQSDAEMVSVLFFHVHGPLQPSLWLNVNFGRSPGASPTPLRTTSEPLEDL